VSGAATISAAPAVAISTQPVNVAVTAGQPATLSVTATGSGPLTYQWRRNGFAITGATAASFTLANASRYDVDFYDVVVSVDNLSVQSENARLSVAPTVYPGLVAPDPNWAIQPEVSGARDGYAVAALGDGRAYIAGDFTNLGGHRRTSVARLNADGTLDVSFVTAEIDLPIRALAVQGDGKVVIGGDFFSVGGISYNRLARLNSDGSLDPTFKTGVGANSSVLSVAVQSDGKILVGGSFSNFAGEARDRLVRLNPDGSLDAAFLTRGMGGIVRSMLVQADGKIVVGGDFSAGHLALSGVTTPRSFLARLEADGSLDAAFAPLVDGSIYAVALQADGHLVVGGDFTVINGVNAARIARLSPAGEVDGGFVGASAGLRGRVNAVAVQSDNKLLLGGDFFSDADPALSCLVRLNADGSRDTGYTASGLNRVTLAIAVLPSGKSLLARSHFAGFSAVTDPNGASRFLRINSDGTVDDGFTPVFRAQGSVNAIVHLPGGKTLVTGFFNRLRGLVVPTGVARINADGSVDPLFNSGGSGANSNVRAAAAQPDGKIFIAGSFYKYNGVAANRLARLNADGSLDPTFDAGTGPSDTVYTLAVLPGGRVLVGGFGDSSRNGGAIFGANGTREGLTGYFFNSTVRTSAVQMDGKMILGEFSTGEWFDSILMELGTPRLPLRWTQRHLCIHWPSSRTGKL
jgi:uncharacterized delta-60 repeat protein